MATKRAGGNLRESCSEAEHFCPEGFASPRGSQLTDTEEKYQGITSSSSFVRKTFIDLMAGKSEVLATLTHSINDGPQTCPNSR